MLKINILTESSTQTFIHCFSKEKYGQVFEVHENDTSETIWDIVLVYENIKTTFTLKHREGGLFFVSGEPPLSRVYPQQFVNQFDVIRTTHRNIKHPHVQNGHLGLNWHFSESFNTKEQRYSFEELENLPFPKKEKLFSVVTSSKRMMPGHNYRQKLISHLHHDFEKYIDFYGNGVNMVDYKCDALMPYMFHICLENTIVKDYWSEKFADSLLGYSLPIYAGCPNISEYFIKPGLCEFNIKYYDELKSIIESILCNPQQFYEERFVALLKNRKKLMSQYTIFDVLQEMLIEVPLGDAVKTTTLRSYTLCAHYLRDYRMMQIKRKCLKWYINAFG